MNAGQTDLSIFLIPYTSGIRCRHDGAGNASLGGRAAAARLRSRGRKSRHAPMARGAVSAEFTMSNARSLSYHKGAALARTFGDPPAFRSQHADRRIQRIIFSGSY